MCSHVVKGKGSSGETEEADGVMRGGGMSRIWRPD